ncbi:hypothetical protein [Nocardioides massiliensis]|uniref:Uncharacterized protein n=1 Tax=Nocardioides massiliensis TaxID=1325935 RepID=A0ABT9NQG7_9ACTN|nr:hypothetical protein [Nocardioides massiliensis]MDP9822512.1 hypothetical protein [Nocardioides massiliensis]
MRLQLVTGFRFPTTDAAGVLVEERSATLGRLHDLRGTIDDRLQDASPGPVLGWTAEVHDHTLSVMLELDVLADDAWGQGPEVWQELEELIGCSEVGVERCTSMSILTRHA